MAAQMATVPIVFGSSIGQVVNVFDNGTDNV